ncbi:DUF4143 domain-containing protein, partial [Patescibacteria group bacterium]|nr:DUF4143 domain-containing protein [Patescibacteria group bacterium]
VAGAIRGNAGAFGKSMKDVIKTVEVFDVKSNKIKKIKNRECKFGYRSSIFKKNPNLIILSAEIRLEKNNSKKIKKYLEYRKKTQPLNFPSAGSIFKNPPGFSAGELILKHTKNDYSLFIARSGNILKDLFEEYLLYYQFPEMVLQEDKDKIRKYITESVYKKTIEYDIPKLFGVEKIDELKFLFQILVNENSSLIEFKTISSEAGIEENTLKKYISYFQESFLVDLLYNYSKSFRKSKRLQKKGYIASSNFFTAFRFDWTENPILRSQYFGSLVETYVFNLLKEKYQYLSFYRKGQDEVDFVASNDYRNSGAHALIEVKYTNEIKWNDIKFIDRIAKKIFKTRYLVYSKSEFKIEENKLIVPCFLIK